ncbi:MAG TPA: prepilin-type N-terminal cleavage/methylation domain-containing protein [Terriglobales bacterium]
MSFAISKMSKIKQFGFTLVELLVVLGIAMVLMAMGWPLVVNVVNSYHLRGASADFANLIQTTRMRAVQDDRYYNLVTNVGPLVPPNVIDAFANTQLASPQNYALGDPAIAFDASILIQPRTAAPNVANLEAQFLPTPNVTINPTTNTWGPSFGPRGLPCQPSAAVGGTCSYTSTSAGANGPGPGLPMAYETFFRNIRNNTWEAVTVNPASRVREWNYDRVTNTWSALN